MYNNNFDFTSLINASVTFGNSPNMLFTEAEALYNPKINRRNFSEIFFKYFSQNRQPFHESQHCINEGA